MVTLVCDLAGRSQHPSCHEGLAHCPFLSRETTGTAYSQAKRDTQAVREVCWPLKALVREWVFLGPRSGKDFLGPPGGSCVSEEGKPHPQHGLQVETAP